MCTCNPNFAERRKWHCLEIHAGWILSLLSPPLQSIFKDSGVNLKTRKVQLERKCHFHRRSEVVILL